MDEIKGLEKQLKDAKKVVEHRDRVERLLRNKDFQRVIMDEFCVTEAARLVHQSADPILTQEQRADALSMAQASGHLKRYIQMAFTQGNLMENQAREIEAVLDAMRAEDDTPQNGLVEAEPELFDDGEVAMPYGSIVDPD
jgi:pyruvate-formate lyase